MKEIQLTQGKIALVDDADFEQVNRYKWYAKRSPKRVYVSRNLPLSGRKRTTQYLHQFLLNPPENSEIDHLDHDGLNNQRSNLRVCSTAENRRNVPVRINNKSGFKGIRWRKDLQLWHARICYNRKRIHLGYFPDPVSAAMAYNTAAKDLHGEFACLNPIPD